MKTIRVIKNGVPKNLTGKDISVNTDNSVMVDGVKYEFDKNTYPNYTRGK